MKPLALAWRLLIRDWKSGELTVLGIALVIAVTSLTAVAFLTDRVGHAVELRAAESLAADLRLGSSQPLSESYIEKAEQAADDIKRTAEMAIQNEITEARRSLKNEVAEQAAVMAEELIVKNLTNDDQFRIIDDYLAKVGAVN